ncbi:TraR/DksA family transcriptional regulator [Teredinibacter turnerae]|uniref:TraR/DksA family transcriptional regulator n=1 Tax=Teredinibacter turnerae TaxID=2426 RepID=UPI000380B5AF|nr:TraR/DksA C4-type zinc finger protein [Teredinibacter turnerae]
MKDAEAKIRELSEKEILEAPESDYMNNDQLEFFRRKLVELYDSTRVRIQEAKDQMSTPISESDPNDRATCEEESSIALRIVEREQKLLPKIQQSLARIRLGTYGYCLESDEPIGIPRLLARPTAEYCAEVKALQEIKEHQFKG